MYSHMHNCHWNMYAPYCYENHSTVGDRTVLILIDWSGHLEFQGYGGKNKSQISSRFGISRYFLQCFSFHQLHTWFISFPGWILPGHHGFRSYRGKKMSPIYIINLFQNDQAQGLQACYTLPLEVEQNPINFWRCFLGFLDHRGQKSHRTIPRCYLKNN